MCFVIDNEYPTEIIATEDIKCYKIMKVKSIINDIVKLQSPILSDDNFQYEIGDVMCADAPLEVRFMSFIDAGIHSFTTLISVTKYYLSAVFHANAQMEYAYKFMHCYIPKGSSYFINKEDKQLVSDKLILVSEVADIKRLLLEVLFFYKAQK